jgi:hypothetical protein
MSFGTTRKSSLPLELQTVEETSRGRPRLVVVLPTLEQLLGEPAFGHGGPIFLPGHRRPLDGWDLFGSVRERGIVLH